MAPMKWIGFFAILTIAVASDLVENKQEKRGVNAFGSNSHSSVENANSELHNHKASTQNIEGSRYAANLDSESKSSSVITKTVKVPVPQPYPVTVDKHVPVPVHVPVDRPYTVEVPKPFTLTRETPVPVYVNRPVPYTVRVPIKVPVLHRVEVSVPKPYPVPINRPYPVNVPKPLVIERQVPVVINQGQKGHGGGYSTSGGQIGSHNGQEFSVDSSISAHNLASGKQSQYSSNGLTGNEWAPLLSNKHNSLHGVSNNELLSNTVQTQGSSSHGSASDLSTFRNLGHTSSLSSISNSPQILLGSGYSTHNSNPSLNLQNINIVSGDDFSHNHYPSSNFNGHQNIQSYSSEEISTDNHNSNLIPNTFLSGISSSGYSSGNYISNPVPHTLSSDISTSEYSQNSYPINSLNNNGHSISQSFSSGDISADTHISDPALATPHAFSNDISPSGYSSHNTYASYSQSSSGHPSLESFSSPGDSTDYHNSIPSFSSPQSFSNDISTDEYSHSSQNSHPINTLTFRDHLTVHPNSQEDSSSNGHASFNSFPSQELSINGFSSNGFSSGLSHNELPQEFISTNDFSRHNSYASNNLHTDEQLSVGSYYPQSLSNSGYASKEINLSPAKLAAYNDNYPTNQLSKNNYAKNFAYADSQNSVQSYPSQSLSVGYSIEDSHPGLSSETAEYPIHGYLRSQGGSNGGSLLSSSSPSHSLSAEGFHNNGLASGFHSSHGSTPIKSKSGGAISYQHVTIYH